MALQNPVKSRFDAIISDIKDVTKAQKAFGKSLDKVRYLPSPSDGPRLTFQALPHRELPMETDAMADHSILINRAIAMHLLREGQFSVASTFVRESQEHPSSNGISTPQTMSQTVSHTDEDGDDDMKNDEDVGAEEDDAEMLSLHSENLQDKFSEMYKILSELKNRNLVPAIEWARTHGSQLDGTGSNLEFELSKLQFVWLFKGPSVNGLPDDMDNGQNGAFKYARHNFSRFQARHLKEIQQLVGAMVYANNITTSPYRRIFEIDTAFDDVSVSFTREFCSLLGLSAESPLYVAVTAGAVALPRLIKYTTYMKEKKTEWTTENELAFETPLPPSMIYHPIFVCPVSKEQATETNPPMMMACGHVICRESLQRIAKGSGYKCPYCPGSGHLQDALHITL